MSRAGSHKTEEEWNVALQRAQEQYPGIAKIDWVRKFSDDLDVMGRMLGDILKLQKAEENPHRRGRRTVPQVSTDKLWSLFDGFTTDPFPVALAALVGKKSLRRVAIKCNMSHMTLYRFLKGQAKPSMRMMEDLARAFNKPACYFAEYRAELISEHVLRHLLENPNESIGLFRQAAELEREE